mgnify:CR=1 FL=1
MLTGVVKMTLQQVLFYNWVGRCRKATADQIPAPNYGHLEEPQPKQDVVPIDIVSERLPEQHTASQMQQMYLDNSHTIEIEADGLLIRMSNEIKTVTSEDAYGYA